MDISLLNDPNLKAYWKFTNGSWEDQAPLGYALLLTPTYSPTTVSGYDGEAKHFNRNNGLEVATVIDDRIVPANNKTLAFWFKPDDYTVSPPQYICGFWGGEGGVYGYWQVAMFETGKLSAQLNGFNSIASSNTVVNGQWNSCVVIQEGQGIGETRLWLNGVKSVSDTASSGYFGTNTPFSVGGTGAYNQYSFEGAVDEVCIFDRALTDGEVITLYPPVKRPLPISNFYSIPSPPPS